MIKHIWKKHPPPSPRPLKYRSCVTCGAIEVRLALSIIDEDGYGWVPSGLSPMLNISQQGSIPAEIITPPCSECVMNRVLV